MKYLLALLFFCVVTFTINAQSAVGTWKTIDDEDGKAKSLVEIYEKNGKIYGKVSKLINPEATNCGKCEGIKKDQPIVGMEILWNLVKDSDTEWEGGKILDPKTGKEYKCKIELTDSNTLQVRGFIGFALLGRTQTWYRVTE
jgi:uncharacterized protein (DUF2147 family)